MDDNVSTLQNTPFSDIFCIRLSILTALLRMRVLQLYLYVCKTVNVTTTKHVI